MNVIPFQLRAQRRASPRAPIPGFGHIPLWTADLIAFGGEIAASSQSLIAIHRDAEGRPIGRDRTVGGQSIRYFGEPGSRRGLVAAPPNDTTRRMALASGPLPLVALAALEDRRDTLYATPSGVWTKTAGDAAEGFIRAWRPEAVVIATHAALAARCIADLAARLRDIEVHLKIHTPPDGDWTAVLQRARTGQPIAR